VSVTSRPAGATAAGRSQKLSLQFGAGVWGLQFGFLLPVLALALSTLLHANNVQIGIALALYNASGFVCSLILPAWADRTGNYLSWMLVSSVATFALAAVLILSGDLVVAIIGMVVVGGPSGVGISLFFAHMRAQGFTRKDIIGTRAMFSLAWAAAAPLALFIADALGARAVLIAVAVIAIAGLLTVYVLRRNAPPAVAPADRPRDDVTGSFSKIRVAAVMVAFIVLMGTANVVSSSMAIFAVTYLHLPGFVAGIALSVAALGEVPALLVLGRLSSRFGPIPLIVSGCIVGVVYYLAMAVVRDPFTLVALQLLRAWLFASFTGVGLTFFQDIIPRPGLASGLFTNTQRVGSVFTGGLIAVAGTSAGWSGVFVLGAGLTVVAMIITILAGAGRRRSPQPAAQQDEDAGSPSELGGADAAEAAG